MVTATNGKPVDHVKCARVSKYVVRKCFLRLAVRYCFSLFQTFSCVAAPKMAHEFKKKNTILQRPKALLTPSLSFLLLLRHFSRSAPILLSALKRFLLKFQCLELKYTICRLLYMVAAKDSPDSC